MMRFWALIALSFATPAFSADKLPCIGEAHLTTGAETIDVPIEIAATNEERATGLMFREELQGGMLFLYEAPKSAAFWMKDTLIPLDMLFFDLLGRVVTIYENATPLDTTPIFGGDNIVAVLELNGGDAAQKALQAGATEIRFTAEGQCEDWIFDMLIAHSNE